MPVRDHAAEPLLQRPQTQNVSANISKLASCTTYHFQLVATNPDGTANGGDKTFTTKFAHPLKKVKAPNKVKAGHKFQVQFTLSADAKVKIVIKKKKGGAVVTYELRDAAVRQALQEDHRATQEGRLRPPGERQAKLRLADRDQPAEGQLTPSSEGRAKSRPSVSPEPTPTY